MKDFMLPPEINSAYQENQQRIAASGREIDSEFVKRGFFGVRAEIELMQRVFGPTSYESYVETQSSPEAFESFRAYDAEVRAQLELQRKVSPEALDAMWDKILKDPLLPSVSKTRFLRGISKERYEKLIAPHLPMVHEALVDEQQAVCKLCPEPAISLYDAVTVDLRKEKCNEVMADAYGRLGFVVFRRSRGVDSYAKFLTEKYAVIVEPDVVLMEKQYSEWRPSPSVYWPLIPFDCVRYLGSSLKSERQRYMDFAPTANCIAASRLGAYDDTRSLEVMLRAGALWYELAIAPFERAVTESEL